MAKRFTNSEKWKDNWFKNLNTSYKLLWLYMWDDCDHAGIWSVDIYIASIRLKIEINEKEAIEVFDGEIEIIDNGNKWFMPKFIEFQYGKTLDPHVNAQRSVLKLLHDNGVDCEDYLYGKAPPF